MLPPGIQNPDTFLILNISMVLSLILKTTMFIFLAWQILSYSSILFIKWIFQSHCIIEGLLADSWSTAGACIYLAKATNLICTKCNYNFDRHATALTTTVVSYNFPQNKSHKNKAKRWTSISSIIGFEAVVFSLRIGHFYWSSKDVGVVTWMKRAPN